MSSKPERVSVPGPAGALECVLDTPDGASAPRGVAVICHPNPQFGGTLDNKVVQTLVRAFLQLGYRTVRLNFRGVGASEGAWDNGRGEVDDALAVIGAQRDASLPLVLAGFSFGAYVVSEAAARLPEGARAERLVLIGPSTQKQAMPAVPDDTLVVHGEADEVVPLSSTLDWARPQALPVVVIPGAGHFFHGQLTLLKNLVLRNWHR
jgi:alpha/beta superfamily hydrolase